MPVCTATPPPVDIYHPVFVGFRAEKDDPSVTPTPEVVPETARFVEEGSRIFEYERSEDAVNHLE